MKLITKVLSINTLIFSSLLFAGSNTSLSVNSGWNMLALPTENSINYSDIKSKLSQINTLWIYKNNKWYAYSPNAQLSKELRAVNIPYMTLIEPGDGFWINSSKSLDISFEGEKYSIIDLDKLAESKNITWALLGTGEDIQSVELSSIHGSLNALWQYENGTWKVYAQNADYAQKIADRGFENLSLIKANSGFWINSAKSSSSINTLAINPPSLPGAVEFSTQELK